MATKTKPKTKQRESVEEKAPVEQVATKVVTKHGLPANTLIVLGDGRVDILYDYGDNEVIKKIREGGDAPYTFYDNGKRPDYVAVQNGAIEPLTFPKPEDYGITSSKLFAMADTYASVIAKFIELRIKGKPSLLSQIRQIGVVAGPMIVIALVILVIIAMIGG